MLEVDLRLSKDGQVVVFHDEKVRVRDNQKKAVSKLTLAEIKDVELDMNQQIQTFEEVAGKFKEMDKIFKLGRKYKPDYLHPCWENYRKTPSSLLTEDFFKKAKEGNFGIVTWHEENEGELKNFRHSLPEILMIL